MCILIKDHVLLSPVLMQYATGSDINIIEPEHDVYVCNKTPPRSNVKDLYWLLYNHHLSQLALFHINPLLHFPPCYFSFQQIHKISEDRFCSQLKDVLSKLVSFNIDSIRLHTLIDSSNKHKIF